MLQNSRPLLISFRSASENSSGRSDIVRICCSIRADKMRSPLPLGLSELASVSHVNRLMMTMASWLILRPIPRTSNMRIARSCRFWQIGARRRPYSDRSTSLGRLLRFGPPAPITKG
jgi:hypothetical protein